MLKTAFDVLFAAVPGVLLIGAGLAIYWTVRHGVPAAIAKLKGWWSKGSAALEEVKGVAAKAQTDVATLEQKVAPQLTALRTEVDALKAKVGI